MDWAEKFYKFQHENIAISELDCSNINYLETPPPAKILELGNWFWRSLGLRFCHTLSINVI